MSLNLYTGSLERFYRGDYERPMERYARENGLQYTLITPTSNSAPLSNDAVKDMMMETKAFLEERAPFKADWDDGKHVYHTEQLTYEGHSALYYASAMADLNKAVNPISREEVDKFSLDSIGFSGHRLADSPAVIFEANIFYPGGPANMHILVAETGERLVLANLEWVYGCLLRIEDILWSGSLDVKHWLRRGPIDEDEAADVTEFVMHNAKFAFAAYRTTLDFALEHNLPIALDF